MAKMTDDELVVLINAHEANSIGSSTANSGVSLGAYSNTGSSQGVQTTVEIDRFNAANYYNGRPFGNEMNDRSQIVLPELRDTVEWLLPQLMRMFASTENICIFDPVKPGDEQMAEQETDAVNYVFLKQNSGFNLLYDAFKDALLFKNYYFKAGWEKKKHISIESYSGLTQDELGKLFMDAKEDDDEIEVLEQSQNQTLIPNPMAGQPMPPQPGQQPQTGQPPQMQPPVIPIETFDIKIRRITYKGQVVIECVAPEDMRVSTRARFDLNECPFSCHVSKQTRSDLIEMGFDKAMVESLPAAKPDWVEMDKLARDTSIDEMSDQLLLDPSIVEVELKDCYIKVDFDGDGVAELRHVYVAGNKVLENEEVPFVPFSTGVPCRMSHRHIGLSMYDLMADLQLAKSMLFRQVLDNTYLINNTRLAVDDQIVNMDDLMTHRPGGLVRVKGAPGPAIQPLEVQNVVSELQPVIAYIDEMRTMRTGVGENTLGLDPDALQNVTNPNGAAALSSAMLKIEMIAMLLGEGLKDLFTKIHALLIMHQDQKLDVQLRGQWVQVDPSQWRTRTAVTLNVGLGSGNRQELRQNAMVLGQAQQQAAALGLVGPKQAFNTTVKLLEGLGLQNGKSTYFLDPDGPEYHQLMQQKQQMMQQQQAQDPRLAAMKGQLQIAQFKAQSEAQQEQAQGQREMAQIQLQAQKNAQQSQMDNQLAMQKSAADAETKMRIQAASAILDFIEAIATSAIKANATPQMIESDVGAAKVASQQVQ